MLVNSKVLCTLARNGSGNPSYRSSACSKCDEWRCKTHCRCGRQGTAKGRHAARPGVPAAKAKAKAKAKAAPAPQPKARAQARPLVQEPDILTDDKWMDRVVDKLPGASAIYVSSMVIDDPAFCEGLASQLRGGRGFSCILVVDKQVYNQGTGSTGSKSQKPRLTELRKLGAEVFLGTGFRLEQYGRAGFTGIMHRKIIVVESAVGSVGWIGSANITKSSRKNREVVVEMYGTPVVKLKRAIIEAKDNGEKL
jgi:hypothetical protein